MSMSWSAWVELPSGQSWSPAEMVGAYQPRYLIECSSDSVLLNVFGPFGYGHRLTWLKPIAPLRNAEIDASPEVFGSPGFRGTSDYDFTWVLLSELEAYDLSQSTVRSGFVSTALHAPARPSASSSPTSGATQLDALVSLRTARGL